MHLFTNQVERVAIMQLHLEANKVNHLNYIMYFDSKYLYNLHVCYKHTKFLDISNSRLVTNFPKSRAAQGLAVQMLRNGVK